HELAGPDRQVDAVQDLQLVGFADVIAFVDAVHLDQRAGRLRPGGFFGSGFRGRGGLRRGGRFPVGLGQVQAAGVAGGCGPGLLHHSMPPGPPPSGPPPAPPGPPAGAASLGPVTSTLMPPSIIAASESEAFAVSTPWVRSALERITSPSASESPLIS